LRDQKEEFSVKSPPAYAERLKAVMTQARYRGTVLGVHIDTHIDTPFNSQSLRKTVSFEKLEREIKSLNGALDIPLLFGELTPMSSASSDINEELKKARPRDISVPQR
jgi:hypothetical protein